MSDKSYFRNLVLYAAGVCLGAITADASLNRIDKSLENILAHPSITSQAAEVSGVQKKAEGIYELVVSLHQLKMYVFMDGVKIKEFPVAVGDFDTPTPTGEYFILNKVKNPSWRIPKRKVDLLLDYPSGRIPAGDPKNPIRHYWIGLRRVDHPGRKISIGIHGTNKPSSIPDWASNGCIRMRKDDIRYIAAQIPNGSKVTIVESFMPEQQADYANLIK